MFPLKNALLFIFGWVMMLGSSDLAAFPTASYTPVDKVVALPNKAHFPLSYDAVLEVNYSYTYEIPGVKLVPEPVTFRDVTIQPSHYHLSYYSIGQNIVVKLTTKAIIFPFHWFT